MSDEVRIGVVDALLEDADLLVRQRPERGTDVFPAARRDARDGDAVLRRHASTEKATIRRVEPVVVRDRAEAHADAAKEAAVVGEDAGGRRHRPHPTGGRKARDEGEDWPLRPALVFADTVGDRLGTEDRPARSLELEDDAADRGIESGVDELLLYLVAEGDVGIGEDARRVFVLLAEDHAADPNREQTVAALFTPIDEFAVISAIVQGRHERRDYPQEDAEDSEQPGPEGERPHAATGRRLPQGGAKALAGGARRGKRPVIPRRTGRGRWRRWWRRRRAAHRRRRERCLLGRTFGGIGHRLPP